MDALEQRYHRASRMAGVLPIGRRSVDGPRETAFFWSLKREEHAAWRDGGLERWKAEVAAFWPPAASLLTEIDTPEQVTFAQYDHFTLARPYAPGVIHIGDAARATSPQLGQGANMALLDALSLSAAMDASGDLDVAAAAYARMRRWHVRLFQAASAIFTPFYQSDSVVLAAIRDHVAAPASRLPMADALLARLVSGLTVSPLRGSKFTPERATC